MRLIDLSHSIFDGMQAYPGLPNAKISPVLDHAQSRANYSNKAEFYLGKVELAGNTGTYIDSPFHRFEHADDLSDLSLDRLAALPGIVLDGVIGDDKAVDFRCEPERLAGKAVLIRTGWDAHWGRPQYWTEGPYLSDAAITALVEAKAALVGVDFCNVDSTLDPARPAHTRLLGAGVLVVEHLVGLDLVPHEGFRFYAVPPKLVGGASFPVRAFAQIEEQ